jgi:hypothetical protein
MWAEQLIGRTSCLAPATETRALGEGTWKITIILFYTSNLIEGPPRSLFKGLTHSFANNLDIQYIYNELRSGRPQVPDPIR